MATAGLGAWIQVTATQFNNAPCPAAYALSVMLKYKQLCRGEIGTDKNTNNSGFGVWP